MAGRPTRGGKRWACLAGYIYRMFRGPNRKAVPMTSDCQHLEFVSNMVVVRHADNETDNNIIGYSAKITVRCAECEKPFQFLGLPMGLDTQGARVSVDGLEARIAISPQGVQPSPMDRRLFDVRKRPGEG